MAVCSVGSRNQGVGCRLSGFCFGVSGLGFRGQTFFWVTGTGLWCTIAAHNPKEAFVARTVSRALPEALDQCHGIEQVTRRTRAARQRIRWRYQPILLPAPV